ncbi:hypothetical protein QR77_36725 [Streptomyces sp. 150FB]|uniref:DUF998 domain-containing protein n=1 Tax=Streptomyces sp. 150FB TaxID=1576605 RepID=UPI0005893100|nr:DUF998 domain-containing protein [Streptomyces sp. 150FB]KIF77877.1 hypothetical protein QR77_36725 [Streptomyces sp. 150FB]
MSASLVPAILGLVGTVGYLVVFGALHIVPSGYHPIHNAVSDYGIGRYAMLFRTGLWLSSAGVLLLAVALALKPGVPPLSNGDLVYLFLVPPLRVAMSLFPTDLEGRPLTRKGALHYLFAVASFAFTYAAISGMTSPLEDVSPWGSAHGLLSVLRWIVLISLILLVVTLMPRLRRVFGLFERLFLVSTNAWFVTVGVCLAIASA